MRRQKKTENSLSDSIDEIKKEPGQKWDKSNLILLGTSLILLLLVLFFVFPSFFTGLLPGDKQGNIPELEFINTPPDTEETKPQETPRTTTKENSSTDNSTQTEENVNGAEFSRQRKSRLFFVKVNDMGQVSLKGSIRTVNYNTSPLTRTINALLQGPDTQELNQGLLTLIPVNTQLLAASIEEEIAYLNFNEEFRRNPMGIEAYEAQLKQIVYTATEFPNIEQVQIVIEGKILDYLGPEGVYIGSPLTRNDF